MDKLYSTTNWSCQIKNFSEATRYGQTFFTERSRRSPGVVYVEYLKLLDDERLNYLTKLFNRIYDTKKITVWSRRLSCYPKIKKVFKFKENHPICRMSHRLNIFLRVIHTIKLKWNLNWSYIQDVWTLCLSESVPIS